MKNTKTIDCGNYYQSKHFGELCEALEQGEAVSVYIDCIGHTRNNYTQEEYRDQLIKKYGDNLIVEQSTGVCSYHYNYKLLF